MAGGLATRCPACDTAFRVVLDQLRVSDGWVRCGRCAEVFNAGERLIDVESGAPRRMPEHAAGSDAALAGEPAEIADRLSTRGIDIEFDSGPFATVADPSPRYAEPALPDWAVEPAATSVERAHEIPSEERTPALAEPAAPDDTNLRAEPAAMPEFLRSAERAERWRQPRVMAALVALLVLGVLGLVGQGAYVYRDLVAARFTATRPLLVQACRWMDCTVGPPQLIESLSVESSGLVRIERSNLYKLSVALRNRAGVEAAMPALDLALTDSQGKLLARRVLRASELGTSQTSLASGRELALQATLQAATDPVAGYTIELFYP